MYRDNTADKLYVQFPRLAGTIVFLPICVNTIHYDMFSIAKLNIVKLFIFTFKICAFYLFHHYALVLV